MADDVEGQVLQDFAPFVDAGHRSAAPATTSDPLRLTVHPDDVEGLVARDFAPYSSAKDSATATALGETTTPGWNTAGNFLDSLLLGYGRNVGAFAESSKTGNILDTYHKKLADLTAARDAWAKENPQAALATNIAGGTIGSLGAMGLGQEYAAVPLASALSKAAPALAPVVEYLGGGAGAYGSGLDAALTRTGSLASRGMLEGASAGLSQSKLGEGSTEDQALGGASAGGLTNALLGPFASRLATSIAPDVAAASRGALAQGVPLRAGQLPGASPIVQTLDKFLSGAKNAPQREAFNSALTTQAGLPAKVIDQNWVAKADALNGSTMERITRGYSLDATDPDLNTDLADLDNRASSQMTFDGEKKWQELRGKLEKDLNTGSVPGRAYQAWTGKGGLLENYAKNPELKPFITGPDGLRDAIDGAWGRSIAATPSPTAGQDFAEWQQARRQYKNTRIIDDGVSEKGEYNPQSLLRAVQKRYGNARRAGDIGDLGTAGQFIYKPESAPAQSHSLLSVASRHPFAAAGSALLGERLVEPALHLMSRDWPTAVAGGAGLIGSAIAAKGANAVTSSPLYMRHLLDIAQGTGKPWLRGNNPLIPAVSDIVSPRQ